MFVLHDLDVAGFSIFGTLASNGRRYTHMNEVPLINIGLRLIDVAVMDLQGERVTVSDRHAHAATLRRHGATDEEIEFLSRRRVELNAMTSRQLSCRSSCSRRRRSRRTTRRSAARRPRACRWWRGVRNFPIHWIFPHTTPRRFCDRC